jgi:PadR family transcriptional regulator PadR
MEARPEMREPTYYLLATLLDGPLHGHGIIKRAKEISDDRVCLAAGTLYAALDRLTREGLIAPAHEETVNGRLRQYYELTPSGTAAVNIEADRMGRAARLVISRRTTSSVPLFPCPDSRGGTRDRDPRTALPAPDAQLPASLAGRAW